MILDDNCSYLVLSPPPPLWIGITLTNFKRLGKTPVIKDTLIILHKGARIRSGINLSSLIGILTGPVDLYSKDIIISSTSSGETCAIRNA